MSIGSNVQQFIFLGFSVCPNALSEPPRNLLVQKSQLIATQTLLDFAHRRHNTDCGCLVSHFATHGAFSTIFCLRPPPLINCSVRVETFEAGHIDVLTLQ